MQATEDKEQEFGSRPVRILAVGFLLMFFLEAGISGTAQLTIFSACGPADETAAVIYEWVHACSTTALFL